jgi:hypothetical protein
MAICNKYKQVKDSMMLPPVMCQIFESNSGYYVSTRKLLREFSQEDNPLVNLMSGQRMELIKKILSLL